MYYHDNNLSVSEKLFNSGLCLPSGSNMTDSEQEFVIDEFKNIQVGVIFYEHRNYWFRFHGEKKT